MILVSHQKEEKKEERKEKKRKVHGVIFVNIHKKVNLFSHFDYGGGRS